MTGNKADVREGKKSRGTEVESVLMAMCLWQEGRSCHKGSHIAASHTILAVSYN